MIVKHGIGQLESVLKLRPPGDAVSNVVIQRVSPRESLMLS